MRSSPSARACGGCFGIGVPIDCAAKLVHALGLLAAFHACQFDEPRVVEVVLINPFPSGDLVKPAGPGADFTGRLRPTQQQQGEDRTGLW